MSEPSRERAPRPGLPPELTESALRVLGDVLLWRLTDAQWERLAGLLDAAESALRSGAAQLFDAATVELALSGPVRVTRIGHEPGDGGEAAGTGAPADRYGGLPYEQPHGPDERVRERLNQLVHRLSGGSPRDGEADGGGGEGRYGGGGDGTGHGGRVTGSPLGPGDRR
ncbi:CATRA system-associated protein [Streptomyces sp. NPDC086091]|uniref:CATRA system-associated protein n=1 Tax=Streptomyces sp. NPDC086091 TaxID=3365751 RepID=UPI0038247EA1